MSSYVVDPKTINTIVNGLLYASKYKRIYPAIYNPAEQDYPLPWHHSALFVENAQEAAELGATLYEMNINATWQRYNDETQDTLPGTHQDDKLAPYTYSFSEGSPARVYLALKEYLYQCSEGDVLELPTYKALSLYSDALAHQMAMDAAEKEGVKWGES